MSCSIEPPVIGIFPKLGIPQSITSTGARTRRSLNLGSPYIASTHSHPKPPQTHIPMCSRASVLAASPARNFQHPIAQQATLSGEGHLHSANTCSLPHRRRRKEPGHFSRTSATAREGFECRVGFAWASLGIFSTVRMPLAQDFVRCSLRPGPAALERTALKLDARLVSSIHGPYNSNLQTAWGHPKP